MKIRNVLLFAAWFQMVLPLSGQNELHYANALATMAGTLARQTISIPGSNPGETWDFPAGTLVTPLLEGRPLPTTISITVVPAAGVPVAPGAPPPAPVLAAPVSMALSSAQLDQALMALKKAIDSPSIGPGQFPSSPGTGSIISAAKQSEILYAVADVLVDRLKEELALAYFERVSQAMDKAHLLYRDCTVDPTVRIGICSTAELMPSTKMLFEESENHISPQIGSTLKAAFMTDLEDLPLNFATSYDAGLKEWAGANCKASVTDVDQIALFSARIYKGIAGGKNWIEVMEELTDKSGLNPNWSKRCEGMDLGLRLLQSILDPKSGKPISVDLNQLSESTLNAYVTLLCQNSKFRIAVTNLGFAANYATLRTIITTIGHELLRAAKAAEQLSGIAPKIALDAEARGMNLAKAAGELKSMVLHTDSAAILLYVALGGSATTLAIPPKVYLYYDAGTALASAVAGGNYGRASLAALKFLDGVLDQGASLDNDLVKLLTLAADIADAEDGEVKKVFDPPILPVGSFRIKQSTTFSVSVNAYAGGAFGRELLDEGAKAKTYGGVFAPIGIDLSWSRGSEKHLRSSHSLLLSALDLGALASYRFASEDSVATAPEVTFDNVFAPGAFYALGFKNSPLSLGAGVQYAPRLRSITDGTTLIANTGAFRIGVFLAVDIPLLHLSLVRGDYNWTERKYKGKMAKVAAEKNQNKKNSLHSDADEYLNW